MAMAKKNTLLYLDENLVRRAKRFGLNLSEITEVALREKLLQYMSAGERQLDFGQHLKDLQGEGMCFELPLELEGVEVRNLGPIDEFKAKFKPGINVVLGPNGSGKSIIFKTVVHVFGSHPPFFDIKTLLKHGKRRGEVKIHLRGATAVELKLGAGKAEHPRACMLLDEPLYAGMPDHKRKFLAWLRRRGGQAILFTTDESFAVPPVHTIRLPRQS